MNTDGLLPILALAFSMWALGVAIMVLAVSAGAVLTWCARAARALVGRMKINPSRYYLRGTSALGLFNTVVGCLFNRVLVVARDSDTHEVVRRYWDLAEAHSSEDEDLDSLPPLSGTSLDHGLFVPPAWSRGNVPAPGIAYLDGRDFEAKPPLTVMRINLWDGVPRKFVVATVRHGQRVRVLEKFWEPSEGRYYYLVRRWFTLGWVAAPFLSPFRMEPTGDRF